MTTTQDQFYQILSALLSTENEARTRAEVMFKVKENNRISEKIATRSTNTFFSIVLIGLIELDDHYYFSPQRNVKKC